MATATTNGKAKKATPVNRIAAKLNGDGKKAEVVKIVPLRQKTIKVKIVGASPYMQARFSEKAKAKMMATQQAGSQARGKKVRDARNYDDDYLAAMYKMKGNHYGIPASAFRNACISACKLVGFHMTKAKLAVFVDADGFDEADGTPLVKIAGKPEQDIRPARNANGSCDLRVRALWREWSAIVTLRFDEDQFSASDVINLLIRVGAQVGVGEGRPDSRESNGLGFGLFEVQFAED